MKSCSGTARGYLLKTKISYQCVFCDHRLVNNLYRTSLVRARVCQTAEHVSENKQIKNKDKENQCILYEKDLNQSGVTRTKTTTTTTATTAKYHIMSDVYKNISTPLKHR